MENKYNKNRCGGGYNSKVGFALLLVLVGGILLGFNLGVIPVEYKNILISWQMLLIVLGFLALFRRHLIGGFALLSVGTFFILPLVGRCFPAIFNDSFSDLHTYWPVLLIIVGILFLFKKKDKKWQHRCGASVEESPVEILDANSHAEDKSGYIEKSVMFSNIEQIVFSSDFKGGDVNVAFGEVKLDLRKVTSLNEKNRMEINVMFGAAVIYVPENWHLNMKSSNMFADIQDKRHKIDTYQETNNLTLHLKASCLFGSIEIRN